jgi:fatty acid-binding protein DegV
VVHVGCEEKARGVERRLRERFGDRDIIVTPASPVLATHLGPGAWGIAWQVDD